MAPPPANNNCANAQPLTCGQTVQGSTTYADSSTGYQSPDVFYSYKGNGKREKVTLLICDPQFNSVIRIYKNCNFNEQIAISNSSITCPDYRSSELNFTSDGVSTYIIMVEGMATDAGDFSLSVSCQDLVSANDCTGLSSQTYGEDGMYFGTQTNQRLAIDLPVGNADKTIYGFAPSIIREATTFSFNLYEEDHGLPGNWISTIPGTIAKKEFLQWDFGQNIYKYFVKFEQPVILTANKTYWIEVVTTNGVLWYNTTNSNYTVGAYGAYKNMYTNAWNNLFRQEFNYEVLCDLSQLSVSDVSNNSINVHPNPVADILNISNTKTIQKVSVVDISGREVFSKDTNSKSTQLNLSHLKTGNYIIKALIDNKVETVKIIKK